MLNQATVVVDIYIRHFLCDIIVGKLLWKLQSARLSITKAFAIQLTSKLHTADDIFTH